MRLCLFGLIALKSVALVSLVRAEGFAGAVCVVKNRAIILYEDRLYVTEEGEFPFVQSVQTRTRPDVVRRLPEKARFINNLSVPEFKDANTHIIKTRLLVGGKEQRFVVVLSADKYFTLKEGGPEDAARWHTTVAGRYSPTPKDDLYVTYDHVLELAETDEGKHRFITISEEKTAMKDRDGRELPLYALVLGEEAVAARFQTIEFSGK